MKIFAYCLREFDEKNFYNLFIKEYNGEYSYSTKYPNFDNVELARGYDAISITPCDMGKEMLDRFYEVGVRYIATRSIGFDHIDLDHAKKLGMGVSHVSYAPETVADYAIMMMLMCCRKIHHILERSKLQDYTLQGKKGKELSDCTVGIIGTGQIGKTVIKHLSGFGCKLLAYDIFPNEDVKQYAEYVSLDELYEKCDIISLHTPSTPENYHMLNKNAFSKMKDDVIIVNTARGALIDTDAIISAIENGKVGQAALDVLEQEDGLYYINRIGDPIANHQLAILRSFPNVLLTPHTAFYTENVVSDMALKSIKGVYDMMNHNENPLIIL